MRIFRLFFLLLFIVACHDDRVAIPLESYVYTPSAPSEGFDKILYLQPPNLKFFPEIGIELTNDNANFPEQGNHWENGGIKAPDNGEFEISGVIILIDTDQRWLEKPVEISAHIGDKVIKISAIVKESLRYGFLTVPSIHYAYFKGVKIPVRKEQLLFFSKSADQKGTSHLADLSVYFKLEKGKESPEDTEGKSDTDSDSWVSTPVGGSGSQGVTE